MSRSVARRLVQQLPPGSDEAREKGCACPVLDNARGRGYMGGAKDGDGNPVYVISGACLLHGEVDFEGSDGRTGYDEGGKG